VPSGVSPAAARAAIKAAISFADRGSPEAELAYDEDCPGTTAEDWKDAERVNIQFTRRRG
jgi:hypothetical protein